MSKSSRAIKELRLRSWPANPYADLPESVMPLTEKEFMKQCLEVEDMDDYEYDV